MKIGSKRLLHTVLNPADTDKADELVVVTITETRMVKHAYGKDQSPGYLAVDDQDRKYRCNWECFDDTSTCPYSAWIRVSPPTMFWDVTMHGLMVPFKPAFLNSPGFNFISYCERHRTLFYTDEETTFLTGCFDCYIEKTYGQDRTIKEPARWVGWR